MSTRGKRSPAKKPSGTTSGTQGDKIGKAGPSIPFTTRRRVNKTVGITNTPPLEVLKQALPSEVQREVAAAAPAPTPEEKMALRKAREGKRPARAHSRQTAEALRKAREAEALRKAREGKRPVTEQQAVPMKLDETHAAGMENQIPKFVGQYETLVPHIDPKAQQAAQEAVDRWISTFTPGGPPPPPTEDPESLQNQLNYAVLELQADAIAAGDVPPPPPLSTDGLALRSFYKMGKFDLTTTLQVQQEILELIGRKRQKLVEETARRLLIVERCIASNYAFNALGITANIKNLLTELLVSGQLPVSFMDILASFISENGGLDIIMNPMGWFASNLGSLVTVDAVNTYIAIWLSNQLIGAQIFAQMTNDEDLNQRIETTGRDLLERLQDDNTFFDQIRTLSSEIATLFDKATANLMAIISTGFNLPEIIIGGTVVTGEQMLAEIPNVLQRFVNESARQTQNYAQLEEQRRGMARAVAIQYRDAPEVARLVVKAAPTRPGLHDLTLQIISQLIGATGQVIRSALVLFGVRTSQPTDVIIRINNRIADTLVGSYLGYMQKLGYAIGEMPEEAPATPPTRLARIPSGEIVEGIFSEGNEEAAVQIAGLIDARVNQMDPAAVEKPCPRRFSFSDMQNPHGQPPAAAAAPARREGERGEEEDVETQPLDLSQAPESQDSWRSANSGSPGPPRTGGARKRKHHSTRSSTSSKSSKSGTRKHGKSKRVKKGGAKTRHMRLAPGAGRRTRKHSKRGRK